MELVLYANFLRQNLPHFHCFPCLYVLFFRVNYVSMQDKKLPESSIHDLAYDLIKALQ